MTMKEYFLENGIVRYQMATTQIIKISVIGFTIGAACILLWGIKRNIND